MPDNEEKRSVPTPPKRSEDAFQQYGDEQDAPLRAKKKPKSSPKASVKGKKRPPVRRAAKKKKGGRKRRVSLFDRLFSGTSASNEEGGLFGGKLHLSFWPSFFVIALVLVLLVLFLQSSNLVVDEQQVTIVGLPSDLEGYRILHLSDLAGKRFGDAQSTLLRELNTLDYDAVFLTGDMVGTSGDPEPLYELLEGFSSSTPVYFISGDSDPGPYRETMRDIEGTLDELVYEDWILGTIERGAIYVDRPQKLIVGNATIWITPADMLNLDASATMSTTKSQMEQEEEGSLLGLEADYDTLPMTSHRYERAQALLDAVNTMQATEIHISLAHIPPSDDFILDSSSHNPPEEKYLTQPTLILAGHYCGGVFRIPFLGAFYIPNNTADRHGWFPAQEDVAGLSTIGETQMYISSGLSTCGDAPLMPFRLFNRPQISILEFTATLPENMLEQ